MAGVNNRNPPFSPFSVNSVTEIRRPPYRGGLGSVIPGMHCNDLLILEQTPKRIRGAGGVAFVAWTCRDVFNALGPRPWDCNPALDEYFS